MIRQTKQEVKIATTTIYSTCIYSYTIIIKSIRKLHKFIQYLENIQLMCWCSSWLLLMAVVS